jgi:hypothetical protein
VITIALSMATTPLLLLLHDKLLAVARARNARPIP